MMQNTQQQNIEPDQSTVGSPTGQYYHEKVHSNDNQAGYNNQNQPTGTNVKAEGGYDWLKSKYLGNPFYTYGLRILQWIFAIVALALAADSLSNFFEGEPRMRFVVFCGAITLVYLIIITLIAIFKQKILLPGAIFITEIVLCIFWLSGFIATAVRYSGFSCNSQNFGVFQNGFFIPLSSGQINGCKSGKAAPAFAAISFLLFGVSAFTLWYNVMRKLMKRKLKGGALFETGMHSNVSLNRSALAFSTVKHPDEELGHEYNTHDDVTTYTNEPNVVGGNTQTYGQTTNAQGTTEAYGSNTATNIGYANTQPGNTANTTTGYGNTQPAGTTQTGYAGDAYGNAQTTSSTAATNTGNVDASYRTADPTANVGNAKYGDVEKPGNAYQRAT